MTKAQSQKTEFKNFSVVSSIAVGTFQLVNYAHLSSVESERLTWKLNTNTGGNTSGHQRLKMTKLQDDGYWQQQQCGKHH